MPGVSQGERYAAEIQEQTLGRMEEAGRYNRWLLDRCRPHLGPRVADVGAGTGTFAEELARDRDLVVALEPDPELAGPLRRRLDGRPNVRVVSAEAAALPDEAEELDAVVSFNVLEHVPDDAEALRAFHAALRPGGRALLLVPAHPALYGPLDEALGHERRYTRGGLAAALSAAGFEVEEARYVNPVGAVGWLATGRLLRRRELPRQPLLLYDKLVPLLRALDALRLPFGLSVWAVARKP